MSCCDGNDNNKSYGRAIQRNKNGEQSMSDANVMAKMIHLENVYRENPSKGRALAMNYVGKGMAAEGGTGMFVPNRPVDMGGNAPVRGVGGPGGGGNALCYSRNFRVPCESFEENCSLYNAFFESVSLDVGTVIDTDFDSVGNFDQLKWNLQYLQGTDSKDASAVSGTPVAGALALIVPTGPTIGYALKWSVAQQLASPVVVTLFEVGMLNISGTVIERTNLQIELPPRTNGGWIYVPGAYRAASGMSMAEAQIQVPGVGATINIANSSDDIVWSVRKLSAFNTWTIDYLNLLASRN